MKKLLIQTILCLIAVESLSSNQKYDYIKTLSGKEFTSFVIKGSDPSSISIEHESGTAKIRFDDLPDDWKAKFNYDPESSKKHKQELNEDIRKKIKNDLIEKKLTQSSFRIKGIVLQKLESGILIKNAKVIHKERIVKSQEIIDTGIAFPGRKTTQEYVVVEDVENPFSNSLAFIESSSPILGKYYENSTVDFDKAWQVAQYEYVSLSGKPMVVPKLCITKEEAWKYFDK